MKVLIVNWRQQKGHKRWGGGGEKEMFSGGEEGGGGAGGSGGSKRCLENSETRHFTKLIVLETT